MAISYNDYADVLFLNPKVPKGYFREGYEKQAVLLPMKACKVLVPYPKEDALNIFQETILKLLNCGAKEPSWLSEKLSLDSELVEIILKELTERKLITKARCITENGKLMLVDKNLSYEMKTGYIFYDYVSKTYMDAFVPDSKYRAAGIRKRDFEQNRIQFFFDDSNPNSDYEEAIVIQVDKTESEGLPSVYDVMKVCRKQKNRERMLFTGEHSEEKDEDVSRFANSNKVSLLGDNSDVYIATYLVVPTGDLVNKSNLQVCYPFGEGFSAGLTNPILSSANKEENAPLKKAIEELKRRQTSLTEKERRTVRSASQNLIQRVDKILSANIRNYPYINQRALEVESKRETIIRLMKENKGKNWETINSNINDYIIAIYRFLAAVLIDVADKHSGYKDLLNRDRKHNADTLSTIALKCKFVDDEVFDRCFCIKKGRVRDAKRSEEVSALIAWNLLEANGNNDHPFYKLGNEMPNFIVEVNKLRQLRDDGMHGNDIEYSFRCVEDLSKMYFRVLSILIEDIEYHEDAFSIDATKVLDENELKHRKEAENMLERIFTSNVNRYSGLSNVLVSLIEEQNYGEEYLNETTTDPFSKKGEGYPTYVSETLEMILKVLCKQRLNKSVMSSLKNYSDEYRNELLKGMQELGFQVEEIPYYNLSNITKSFDNYRMGTLQSNFYVWYFSELGQQDCMLAELAIRCPLLIQVVHDAVKVREHKGFLDYKDKRLDLLKANLVDCMNSLVNVMVERGIY